MTPILQNTKVLDVYVSVVVFTCKTILMRERVVFNEMKKDDLYTFISDRNNTSLLNWAVKLNMLPLMFTSWHTQVITNTICTTRDLKSSGAMLINQKVKRHTKWQLPWWDITRSNSPNKKMRMEFDQFFWYNPLAGLFLKLVGFFWLRLLHAFLRLYAS